MNIIVTGASKGIGRACVHALASTGQHTIIGIARDQNALEKIGIEYSKSGTSPVIIPIVADINTETDRQVILNLIKEKNLQIDILINNAGALINKPIKDLNSSDFDTLFNTNVKSAFFLTQLLLSHFSTHAHIVNISSMGGYQGSVKFPGLSLYSASKGALAILTESMAEELKEHKINCNCLALGAVNTEMLAKVFPDYKADVNADAMGEYIADFALKAHHYINGKIIPVSLSTP